MEDHSSSRRGNGNYDNVYLSFKPQYNNSPINHSSVDITELKQYCFGTKDDDDYEEEEEEYML